MTRPVTKHPPPSFATKLSGISSITCSALHSQVTPFFCPHGPREIFLSPAVHNFFGGALKPPFLPTQSGLEFFRHHFSSSSLLIRRCSFQLWRVNRFFRLVKPFGFSFPIRDVHCPAQLNFPLFCHRDPGYASKKNLPGPVAVLCLAPQVRPVVAIHYCSRFFFTVTSFMQ